MKLFFLLGIGAIALVLILFRHPQDTTLSAIEALVARTHPVPTIDHNELQQKLAQKSTQPVVLFDIRSAEEYATGHLPGAIRVDSDMPAHQFVTSYADSFRGRQAVFYCSVGSRSSIFIERVDSLARQAGARELENLRGGIFRWYNEGLPVFDAKGPTDRVHPYHAFWGRLLIQRRSNE